MRPSIQPRSQAARKLTLMEIASELLAPHGGNNSPLGQKCIPHIQRIIQDSTDRNLTPLRYALEYEPTIGTTTKEEDDFLRDLRLFIREQ